MAFKDHVKETREFTVACTQCQATATFSALDKATAVRAFKQVGWSYDFGGVICSVCRKKLYTQL